MQNGPLNDESFFLGQNTSLKKFEEAKLTGSQKSDQSSDSISVISDWASSVEAQIDENTVGNHTNKLNRDDHSAESSINLAPADTLADSRTQLAVTLFIAGIGTCIAGMLLDEVQSWSVFQEIEVLLVALPALLGLKGNLQMTLASRLSTQAHMGHVKTWTQFMTLLCTNIALNQAQASIISLLTSIVSFLMYAVAQDSFTLDRHHALLVTANAMLSSSLASFVLDIVMLAIVYLSAWFRVNPDNIATPTAASLGDITALLLYAFIGQLFYDLLVQNVEVFEICSWFTIGVFALTLPAWILISRQSKHTIHILTNPYHWYPLMSAMIVGSLGGLVLSRAVSVFPSIALFHPIVCGLAGNLAAVQASRLSSYLHRNRAQQRRLALLSHPNSAACDHTCLPPEKTLVQTVATSNLQALPSTTGDEFEDAQTAALAHSGCINPFEIIYSSRACYSITRFLLIIALPGHLIFFLISSLIRSIPVNVTFALMYLLVAELEVFMLLYLAFIITFAAWIRAMDPDNSTIPYLTSIGDLLGASFLTIVYVIGASIGVQPEKEVAKKI